MEEKQINMIEPVEKTEEKPPLDNVWWYTCVDCGGKFPIKESKLEKCFTTYGTLPRRCKNCKERREQAIKNVQNK